MQKVVLTLRTKASPEGLAFPPNNPSFGDMRLSRKIKTILDEMRQNGRISLTCYQQLADEVESATDHSIERCELARSSYAVE